jgi:hypothetical protein
MLKMVMKKVSSSPPSGIEFVFRIYLFVPAILIFSASVCFPGFGQVSDEPVTGSMAGQPVVTGDASGSGLLFYLSGENGFEADRSAGGQLLPNYNENIHVIPDGAVGKGFQAEDNQLLSYWAPGNIYAQRGTLMFFWRSRYPAGPTPFPIFRVSYADHSSWDMVWLRIDYNGAGFDAFVTDIGLSRTRVSWYMDEIPDPGEWIHLALSWDETEGIRFYINGKLVARESANSAVYDTGLDQMGPHSRIISPYQVQSAYSFMRGGDMDELRIYDRMLSDELVAGLAKGDAPDSLPVLNRNLENRKWRDAWWLRNGWNLPNPPPPVLPSTRTSIRKVEIHDAYDIKRWYWKANDGIRETTWPGVYNMSRLPGRYDYFVLPDWDCYSGSGQSVTFTVPDEKWNHVEIWGKAWGQLTYESGMNPDHTFGVRTRHQVKSFHHLTDPLTGGKIRFDNALIEEPIGSFDLFYVAEGGTPEGAARESFTLVPAPGSSLDDPVFENIASFIRGRYPAEERSMMVAVPDDQDKKAASGTVPENSSRLEDSYPFIHILVPYSGKADAGLDGIEITMPEFKVEPTHGDLFPLNIRVKDPLWPMRDLIDFSFSVKPGDAPVLWIDARDRILPDQHALYITIAGAGTGLNPDLLTGTRVSLVYKRGETARIEHEKDRFTQVRDLYAHIVEERPGSPRLNLYNRFMADCNDLLTVNPDHWLAQTYRYAVTRENRPEFNIPPCPDDVPEWAYLQAEYLRSLERIASYYMDKRQIANGEFGGGLSDDGDLTNMWPGMALLGIEPDKILNSLRLHMSAYYDQEREPYLSVFRQRSLPLFTNGLPTITTDELHTLEEGIQVVGQLQLLDYGNPLYMERGMETASRLLNDITRINNAGHRHFRSRYYGGTSISTEEPWHWSVNRNYLILHSSYLLAWYNGNPMVRRMIMELADGLLAHYREGTLYSEINFETDQDRLPVGNRAGRRPWTLLTTACKLTGDKKYLEPVPKEDPVTRAFNRDSIADSYREEIIRLGINEYINTEGSIWIDRLTPFNPLIQQDRLGGTALTRINMLYPEHMVSWRFSSPARFDDVAIFLPEPSESELKVIAFNLNLDQVDAVLTAWNITPGRWQVRQGIDTNDDQKIDSGETTQSIELRRGSEIPFRFSPRQYNIVTLKLIEPSPKTPWELPDLAMGPEDIRVNGNRITFRVHNIGATGSPETTFELRGAGGMLVATGAVPPLEAPVDLIPRWKDITVTIDRVTDLSHGSLVLDPEERIREITRKNTKIIW